MIISAKRLSWLNPALITSPPARPAGKGKLRFNTYSSRKGMDKPMPRIAPQAQINASQPCEKNVESFKISPGQLHLYPLP